MTLMFIEDSKNEAIYTAAGEYYWPQFYLKQVHPIEDPTPVGDITVYNSGSFISIISTINENTGINHVLDPDIHAKGTGVFDLTKVKGLKKGDTFQIKVICATSKAESTDETWLMYTDNSKNEAVYNVGGDANTPTIYFKELRPIVVPITPVGNCRQISLFNNGSFTATSTLYTL
ncbi:hypothetical protein BDP27DRAFT_1426124 [Rhodocollybia butyracea]|uniref:Uncharacterized protein n=1 Tax=Rhodocollybia butyracea TaxID=206335 RepID=A0A9P5PKC8_9AGAR|nr:hypothetical protein BDP27DRAFT_1426124 [Rhodocollybia butyracea]